MVLESLLFPLVSDLLRSSVVAAVVTAVLAMWWLRSRHSDGKLKSSSFFGQKQAAVERREMKRAMNNENEDSDNSETSDPSASLVVEEYERVRYPFERMSEEEMIRRSAEFFQEMKKRRTIRDFSNEPVPWPVMENLLKTAGSSPSGANAQPWTYVVVSDQKTKDEVRRIVELEEEINYERRMGKQWVDDLKPFKTSWEKPYLSEAPYLILVFKQVHSYDPATGKKRAHYYQEISVSLSVGILLAAIQNAGLVTLTSTPLNCGPGLRTLLNRPEYEKLVLLLPVGYPAKDATVPKLGRKQLSDFVVHV